MDPFKTFTNCLPISQSLSLSLSLGSPSLIRKKASVTSVMYNFASPQCVTNLIKTRDLLVWPVRECRKKVTIFFISFLFGILLAFPSHHYCSYHDCHLLLKFTYKTKKDQLNLLRIISEYAEFILSVCLVFENV